MKRLKAMGWEAKMRSICIIGTLLLVLVLGCKKVPREEVVPSSVTVYVKDESGNILQGAIVRLYNNKNAYLLDKQQGSEDGFISKVITDGDGKAKFDDLDSRFDYFFLVTYQDRVHFEDLDNSGQNFEFDEFLSNGTESYVEIRLTPAQSLVSFYTLDTSKNPVPIVIKLDTAVLGSVTEAVKNVPTATSTTGALSYRLRQGKHIYSAISSEIGCFWQGEIEVSGSASFTPVALSKCEAGSVIFYADSSTILNLPISITLNDNNNYLVLSKPRLTDPSDCSDHENTVFFSRGAGTYSYSAFAKHGGCNWSGSFTLDHNCKIIKLSGADCK